MRTGNKCNYRSLFTTGRHRDDREGFMNEVASKTALTDWVCHILKREGRWLLKWGASIETEKMYEYMLVLNDTIFFLECIYSYG